VRWDKKITGRFPDEEDLAAEIVEDQGQKPA
jgi:hypothetical protein